MALPLEGITVLDLSFQGPGPFCTMILGDLGADVIKVERPGTNAILPHLRAHLEIDRERRWALFDAYGRNKRSIILDLKKDEGRAVFHRLAETADVVVEGFKPGTVQKLGVGYETLRRSNPKLVYCSISGYGQEGPYRELPGHDVNYIAVGGALGIIGEKGGPPVIPSNLIADLGGGGMYAALCIVAALHGREKGGTGQYLDVSLLDGVMSLMTWQASLHFASGKIPRRGETQTSGLLPFYSVFETLDGGFLSIGCIEPHFWERLCKSLGLDEFVTEQYAQGDKRERIMMRMREVFRGKTRDEWFNILGQEGICVAPVYALDEVASDPQVAHRRLIAEIDHPEEGRIRQVGVPFRFSEVEFGIRRLGVSPGEDTKSLLVDKGYTLDEIELLENMKAIAGSKLDEC